MPYHVLGISSGLYAVIFSAIYGLARWLEVQAGWLTPLFKVAEVLAVIFAVYVLINLAVWLVSRLFVKAVSAAPPQ